MGTARKTAGIPRERVVELYRRMVTARLFDQAAEDLFGKGRLPSSIHTCIGEEAVPVGVCGVLKDDDYVLTTHRGHGWFVGKGAPVDRMMAELLGRSTGLCKGKSGSMHFVWPEKGLLGSNGIVGAGPPIAVGIGMAIKYRKKDQVVVVQFGDGASSEGSVHEAMNMAAVWKLPVIFALENNGYAISVSSRCVISVEHLAVRAAGYGMPGETVDGMDVVAVVAATEKAVKRARRGDGPTLLEFDTYRYHGHSRGDPMHGPYRTKEEVESWMAKDALKLILERGLVTAEEAADIEQGARAAIALAIEYAESSPEPAPEEALEDIWA